MGMGPKFDVADLLGPLLALPFVELRLIARPRVDTGAYVRLDCTVRARAAAPDAALPPVG